MSIAGLVIGLGLITVTIVIAVLPLLGRQNRTDTAIERQRERLIAYYERALRNVRDLDEDHDLGKIGDSDYAAERETWMQRGVQALKTLDQIDAQASPINGTGETEIDAAIEKAVAAMKAQDRS
ncbi:MAG: hypothetical protein U0670_03970 [Anaerolineae bacterium]